MKSIERCNVPLPQMDARWPQEGREARPKETWRRTEEMEMKEQGWTWGYLERCAADRSRWRALVAALCAVPREGDALCPSSETF